MKTIVNKSRIMLCVCFIFTATLCLCFSLTGCKETDQALYRTAAREVPAMHNYASEPVAKITVLETDDYGRILFHASKNGGALYNNKGVSAYIICQYKQDGVGYCYPDICYELEYWEKGDTELEEARLADLKERNDWNKEIDREKCKGAEEAKAASENSDLVKELFFTETGKERLSIVTFCQDVDAEGRELYAISYVIESSGLSFESEPYLMMIGKDQKLLLLEKIDDLLKISDSIIQAKERVGWKEAAGMSRYVKGTVNIRKA